MDKEISSKWSSKQLHVSAAAGDGNIAKHVTYLTRSHSFDHVRSGSGVGLGVRPFHALPVK